MLTFPHSRHSAKQFHADFHQPPICSKASEGFKANIKHVPHLLYNQKPVIRGATCPHNSKLLFEQVLL